MTSLQEKIIYTERKIVSLKNKPLKKWFFVLWKKHLENKWEREWLKK